MVHRRPVHAKTRNCAAVDNQVIFFRVLALCVKKFLDPTDVETSGAAQRLTRRAICLPNALMSAWSAVRKLFAGRKGA